MLIFVIIFFCRNRKLLWVHDRKYLIRTLNVIFFAIAIVPIEVFLHVDEPIRFEIEFLQIDWLEIFEKNRHPKIRTFLREFLLRSIYWGKSRRDKNIPLTIRNQSWARNSRQMCHACFSSHLEDGISLGWWCESFCNRSENILTCRSLVFQFTIL